MKLKFIPNSPHERHQKYFDAFLIEDGLTNSKYLNYITQYIFDTNLSPDNNDDLEFFKNLLFESIKGKVHINYYDWVVSRWTQLAFEQTVETLVRYSYFLGKLSDMFLHDFFNYLLKSKHNKIIINLFPKLDHYSKVQFIKWVDLNPEVIKMIPKLKMYLLFT